MEWHTETLPIDDFAGVHSYLSNFSNHSFEVDGLLFRTNEHYFHYHKTLDKREREHIRFANTPGEAKRLGRKAKLRLDWDDVKERIMWQGLLHKFTQNPELINKLLRTKERMLIEGNTWHDNVWGICYCAQCQAGLDTEPQNLLGKQLMMLRSALRVIGGAK